MVQLILACVAVGIFIAYNAVILGIFGMLPSLSDSYYYLNNKWPGSGIAFQIMMFVVAGLLLYPWMYVGTIISSWSVYLGILPFATCVLLMFVAAAPNFRQDFYTCETHMICAKTAAGTALAWVVAACWQIAYIIPVWLGLCWFIAWITKTMKSGRDWWWEMCAFGPTFTAIITELAMHL